jgi:starch synthase
MTTGCSHIAIVTTGRFFVLDLARELAALGHKLSFYSTVPRKRAAKFGLPRECHRSLLVYVFPLVGFQYLFPKLFPDLLDRLIRWIVDVVVAIKLEQCDIFIGMSGLCVRSAKAAREKYEAKIFIERGSRHILSQKEILEALPNKRGDTVSIFTVERELWAYEYADVISVPSNHARQSFIERGVSPAKIFSNPLGVDLEMFSPTAGPPFDHPTVIFVGIWGLRKGCDVLWEACRASQRWRLLHIGRVDDLPFPNSPLIEHVEPIPQECLRKWYQRAHVSVLCSREDGFGLVLAQALACGLPIVCTDKTGGEDLRQLMDDKKWVFVIPADDPGATRRAIEQALALSQTQTGARDILGNGRARVSWRAYGKRYSDEIARRLQQT